MDGHTGRKAGQNPAYRPTHHPHPSPRRRSGADPAESDSPRPKDAKPAGLDTPRPETATSASDVGSKVPGRGSGTSLSSPHAMRRVHLLRPQLARRRSAGHVPTTRHGLDVQQRAAPPRRRRPSGVRGAPGGLTALGMPRRHVRTATHERGAPGIGVPLRPWVLVLQPPAVRVDSHLLCWIDHAPAVPAAQGGTRRGSSIRRIRPRRQGSRRNVGDAGARDVRAGG